MAQQDKTDWYWNGVLAGAANNLYYDFINVDVVHVPYATTHRNSSFFLQTRRSYIPSEKWADDIFKKHMDWDVVDAKYIWDKTCDKSNGRVYLLLANKSRSKITVDVGRIEDGCVYGFDWAAEGREFPIAGCGNFKLFSTSYVKGANLLPRDVIILNDEDIQDCHPDEDALADYSGIQINKYEGGNTYGYFSDAVVEDGTGKFRLAGQAEDCSAKGISIGDYLLVYDSENGKNDGFAGQVRLITGIEDGRIVVDTPWQGFETPTGDVDEVSKGKVKYRIFKDWGKTVGFTDGWKVYIVNALGGEEEGSRGVETFEVYRHDGPAPTDIISVADVADKIYILTDNGWIHYSHNVGYNKFFIEDDVFVGSDKLALTEYRDMLLAFGDKSIAVGIPNEGGEFSTLYNQSATMGLWSRYSFAEYDGDMLLVSNDKRLVALSVAANTGKYMLQYEDVGDSSGINGKLSVLTAGDEVYIGNDNNDLRVFINTKSMPFYNILTEDEEWKANLTGIAKDKYKQNNSMTRVLKFDKQFRVWTEDWVQGILLFGADGGIYYGESGIYKRGRGANDVKGNVDQYEYPFKTYISAYLIENESDWVGGTGSRLANRPKLYNLAKLNRLITTLGPGVYSHNSKIKITSYVKGLGTIYEFPLNPDTEDDISWVGLVTDKFLGKEHSEKELEKLECMASVIQDSQKSYQPKCLGEGNAAIQNLAQQQPWCDNYDELLTFDKGICINDSLYEIAPTMPLVTKLGEGQDYATQIKLELEGCPGDIITFGGWLGEMFVAPLFTVGPDGEYQLQPNTDC